MKKKLVNVVLILFTFSPLFLYSQENSKVYEEDKEVYLKVDEKWVKSLEQYDTGKEEDQGDRNLSLDTYRGRFSLLDVNTNLNIDYNDITYSYVKKYLSYKWYHRIIGLSTYYFPLFEAGLEKYGLPKEIKYLAVVESALNPRAGSWAGAKGLWQFMPATGRQYGLYDNKYYSGFYDPVKNTDAAARYLRDLYNEFKDWNLAISAYNCGSGNVRKAIRNAGSKSYWKVRPFLPAETRAYVPSFIAVNYIFNFYRQHNIKPMYFKYNFYDIKMISNNNPTSFKGLNSDTAFLRFANPQFITDYIPSKSIIYTK